MMLSFDYDTYLILTVLLLNLPKIEVVIVAKHWLTYSMHHQLTVSGPITHDDIMILEKATVQTLISSDSLL